MICAGSTTVSKTSNWLATLCSPGSVSRRLHAYQFWMSINGQWYSCRRFWLCKKVWEFIVFFWGFLSGWHLLRDSRVAWLWGTISRTLSCWRPVGCFGKRAPQLPTVFPWVHKLLPILTWNRVILGIWQPHRVRVVSRLGHFHSAHKCLRKFHAIF